MNLPALSALPLLRCNGSFHHRSLGPEMQHFPQRTATVCAGCPRPRTSPLPRSAAPHRPPLHRLAQAPWPVASAGSGHQSVSGDRRGGKTERGQAFLPPRCLLPGLRLLWAALPPGCLSSSRDTSSLSPRGRGCLPRWLISGCLTLSCVSLEPCPHLFK